MKPGDCPCGQWLLTLNIKPDQYLGMSLSPFLSPYRIAKVTGVGAAQILRCCVNGLLNVCEFMEWSVIDWPLKQVSTLLTFLVISVQKKRRQKSSRFQLVSLQVNIQRVFISSVLMIASQGDMSALNFDEMLGSEYGWVKDQVEAWNCSCRVSRHMDYKVLRNLNSNRLIFNGYPQQRML